MRVMKWSQRDWPVRIIYPESFLETLAILWRMRYDPQIVKTTKHSIMWRWGWKFAIEHKRKDS